MKKPGHIRTGLTLNAIPPCVAGVIEKRIDYFTLLQIVAAAAALGPPLYEYTSEPLLS
jgi:hypothetical protein